MTAIMIERRALATASAYLRLNHRTRHADIVHGSQVDFVLTEVHEDRDVRPLASGGFAVTADDWTVIQYAPLADNQDLRQLADLYQHWAAPTGGKPIPQTQPMSSKGLAVLIRRAPGHFCLTRVGEIAHLQRGRIINQFKPLTAADMAKAA
ncbi:hypothetical protein AB0E08_07645 [Streptomyces sp. NPDC048281]|uniref:hypothetical protein n=1 Tax=Streptomyces sp. NPDC048281 TaxID=3154715 RepID=UPI0034145A53